jgi:hypothetical protein
MGVDRSHRLFVVFSQGKPPRDLYQDTVVAKLL